MPPARRHVNTTRHRVQPFRSRHARPGPPRGKPLLAAIISRPTSRFERFGLPSGTVRVRYTLPALADLGSILDYTGYAGGETHAQRCLARPDRPSGCHENPRVPLPFRGGAACLGPWAASWSSFALVVAHRLLAAAPRPAAIFITTEDCRRSFDDAGCRALVERAQSVHADTAPLFQARDVCTFVYGPDVCAALAGGQYRAQSLCPAHCRHRRHRGRQDHAAALLRSAPRSQRQYGDKRDGRSISATGSSAICRGHPSAARCCRS